MSLGRVDQMFTPGAATSTLLPKFEKLARWSLWSSAATAITSG